MTCRTRTVCSPLAMAMPNFKDEFEEMRARANSGGSLYGLMKQQVMAQSSKVAPGERIVKRQRSKSLIPKSVALPEEKGILKMLCEYTQAQKPRPEHEPRRYSAACVDARDVHRRPLSPHRLCPPTPNYGRARDSGSGEHESRRRTRDKRGSWKLPRGLQSPEIQNEEFGSQLSPPLQTPGTICRRRSFSLTPKGLINEGDDLVSVPFSVGTTGNAVDNPFGSTSSELHLLGCGIQSGERSRASSCNSAGSTYESPESCGDSALHRVLMLGGPGVGKTALTQQFLTSEYMAAQNTSFDDAVECTVPVLLDGEEAILEFIDLPYTGDPEIWREYDVEGYIIVYSITDRRSYQKAIDLLNAIRRHRGPHTTLILVANKSDLERSRMVGKQEGKGAAEGYDCKYTEVSAILNHKVDDLLVGTLKQIRLSLERETKQKKKGSLKRMPRQESRDSGCLPKSPNADSAIRRLIRSARRASKSCENLFSL